MSRSELSAALQRNIRPLVIVLTAFAVIAALVVWIPRLAHAGDVAKTPVAPPGPGPVGRALPASGLRNHGYPDGQRPPIVPPGTHAAPGVRHLSAAQWAAVPKPGSHRHADGPPPGAVGAQNVLVRSGFALDDTSLVVYFDAADPGVSNWATWLATVYDPETQAAQDSKPLSPAEAVKCATPRQFCRSFGVKDGWSLVDGHPYFVTITVTCKDGTQSVSDPSGTARARTTASPPGVPAGQVAGCSCPDALSPTTASQAIRGSGVQTGTGAFTIAFTDLRMAGPGVPFTAIRRYSSANTTGGSLGVGWSWTYDVRVIPPAPGQSAVTVRAEDGAQAVYTRQPDGSYVRPPGVRSTLSATATGWRLVTPDQISYSFDQTGRVTAIRNARGLGTSVAYTATKWTITDAVGRTVAVDLGSDGLVKAITLPDRRSVTFQYHSGQLSAMTDATGATWRYGYTGTLLSTVTDPQKRVQITTVYAGGRVDHQVDATGAVTTFRWDGKSEATTIDADGVKVFDGYSGNVLIYTQNGNGDVTNQRYDPQVDPDLVVDPQGNQTQQGFDAAGNVTSVTAPDPFDFSVSNTYDSHNNVTAHTDGLGHTTTYGYTSFDELQTVTDPGGQVTAQQRDDRGLVTSITDPRGKVTKMAYDAAGNLLSRTTPMGEKTTYTYDGTGRLVSMTDPRGNLPGAYAADFTTRYSYDALDRLRKTFEPRRKDPVRSDYDDLGQLTQTVDPLGDTTKFSYARVIGRMSAVTDPNGNTTKYAYTAAGRRSSTTDAAGDRTTFAYDLKGNLATVVSPRGNVKGANPADFATTYTYDTNNNLLRTEHTYPGGGFVDVDTRYDELNRPTTTIDALGKTSSTGYDNAGQITSSVDPLGHGTTITYDLNGRPSAVVSPSGGRDATEYDKAGNPIRRTSASGGVTTWTYNDDGLTATMVEARGNVSGANPGDYTTTYSYDAAKNLVSVTDPLGHTTRSSYDGSNRLTSVADANGHVTRFTYDDANRLVTVVGPDAVKAVFTGPSNNPPKPAATLYTYDAVGHVTSRTDPNKHNTRYTYDAVGRLSSMTDPLGRQTTYAYDAESELVRTVTPGPGDAAARSIVTTYDLLDRKVGTDLAHGGTIYAWGYDARNQVTSLADPSGLRTQTYDEAGRLATVSRDGKPTFTYGYDVDNNVTSRDWHDGTTVSATFNSADQMTGLTVQGGVAGSAKSGYTFGYDPAGRLATTTDTATGAVSTRGYDRAGRLVDLDSHDPAGAAVRYQLTLDAVNNPTSVVTTRGTASQTVGYTYDAADRVTAATTPTGTTTYTYDLVGNRLTEARTGSAGSDSTRYSYDSADELTSTTTKNAKGSGTVQYAYDALGNQTKAGSDTFTYNLDRTLASATVNGVRTSYAYDAAGLQLSATTNTSTGPRTRSWATDVNGTRPEVSLETTATPGSSTSRGFLSGPQGAPLALLTGGQVDTYLPDWLGGVATVVSPQGQAIAAYDYDAYGNPRTDGTAGSAKPGVDNPIQFAGMYLDGTLGSRYTTTNRQYAPDTGRFDSVDPVSPERSKAASSSYAYVADRPTALIDPTGADPCSTGGDGCDAGTSTGPSAADICGPYMSPDTCELKMQAESGAGQTPPVGGSQPDPCGPYMSPDTCLAKQQAQAGGGTPPAGGNGNGNGGSDNGNNNPPPPKKQEQHNPIAKEIGYWAGKIADVVGFIPGFLCGPCTIISAALMVISGIAYIAADMWPDAIAAFIGAAVGFIAGAGAAKAIESLIEKLGLTMVYRAQHYANAVERWVPRSLRVQLEWIVSAAVGMIGAAYDVVSSHITSTMYGDN